MMRICQDYGWLETFSRINQAHPEVPVIMITKSEGGEPDEPGHRNQIADYLIKACGILSRFYCRSKAIFTAANF